ncbi:zinc knuckle protein [Diplocarpon rosae]|nr:zinc knuckle protein [Diplocarpon rosae]
MTVAGSVPELTASLEIEKRGPRIKGKRRVVVSKSKPAPLEPLAKRTVAMALTKLVTALPVVHPSATTVVEDMEAKVVEPKSATSVQRLATLPATALRLVDTVAVASAANLGTVVDKVVMVVEEVKVDKLATRVVVMAICPVIAPKAKSATTVVRLVTFPATARPRTTTSVLAISASNLATSRLNAKTRPGFDTVYDSAVRTDE